MGLERFELSTYGFPRFLIPIAQEAYKTVALTKLSYKPVKSFL